VGKWRWPAELPRRPPLFHSLPKNLQPRKRRKENGRILPLNSTDCSAIRIDVLAWCEFSTQTTKRDCLGHPANLLQTPGQHVLQEAVGCVSTHRSDANSSGRKTRKWCVKTHPTELTWNGSTNSNLQQYEIRVSSGATYDAGTASVAGQVLAGTEEFRTTQELLAPGDTATFKVYVILTTGNEAGSNTVSITRM
jgi:hypothetical protein